MSATQVHLRGKVFSISTAENPELVAAAVARSEELLEALSAAIGAKDKESLYLLALLNRTMELEKMKTLQHASAAQDDSTVVNWARSLAEKLEAAVR